MLLNFKKNCENGNKCFMTFSISSVLSIQMITFKKKYFASQLPQHLRPEWNTNAKHVHNESIMSP